MEIQAANEYCIEIYDQFPGTQSFRRSCTFAFFKDRLLLHITLISKSKVSIMKQKHNLDGS